MHNRCSEIGFMEAVNTVLHNYGPIKIYYNGKIIWDDDWSLDEGWITLYEAIEKFISGELTPTSSPNCSGHHGGGCHSHCASGCGTGGCASHCASWCGGCHHH